ncbi:MAG: ATP synthase F1 subunit delta [Robiginitalea sp.]|jgi:F-type H+-transporting ATPase subunit delta
MSERRAAYRYAKALMDLATEQKKVQEVHDDMRLILDTIEENNNLSDVLQSPILTAEAKKNALQALFSKADALTGEFFNLLSTNKRVGILAKIAEQYIVLYDQLQGQDIASVTTAVPLDKNLESKILKQLKKITGKDVVIENHVDPDLIGGFILRLGDLEYNSSIASKLGNLKRELIK